MRKALFFLILAVSFLLTGCGEDRYSIEKRYYQALKKADIIFKNPHSTPPYELQQAVNGLSVFQKKYPNTKIALDAEFNIARLYMAKEEWIEARKQLNAMLSNYNKNEAICAEVYFVIGKTYELDKNWETALTHYEKIMSKFPATPRGMNIPIYLIQYYKSKFEPDKMMDAARMAIVHYTALSKKYPNTILEYSCRALVINCYAILKDWNNVAANIESSIDAYKAKAPMDTALFQLAFIYDKQLKDPAKTRATLERLIREYPKSKFIKAAKKVLEERKE